MNELNEKILNKSFGIEKEEIYPLEIKMTESEKRSLKEIINYSFYDEYHHFMEGLWRKDWDLDHDHIFKHWLRVVKSLPKELKSEWEIDSHRGHEQRVGINM